MKETPAPRRRRRGEEDKDGKEIINPLSTKLYLSDLKTHFVPRAVNTLCFGFKNQ